MDSEAVADRRESGATGSGCARYVGRTVLAVATLVRASVRERTHGLLPRPRGRIPHEAVVLASLLPLVLLMLCARDVATLLFLVKAATSEDHVVEPLFEPMEAVLQPRAKEVAVRRQGIVRDCESTDKQEACGARQQEAEEEERRRRAALAPPAFGAHESAIEVSRRL